MTTWRHTNEWHSDFTGRTCCMAPRDNGSPCECATPTPDPASPCGRSFDKAMSIGSFGCLFPEDHEIHDEGRARGTGWRYHPHVPTRCICGHPIEATR